MTAGRRVRLTADLTKYNPAFREGAEGITMEPAGMWARQQPERYVTVRIGSDKLDVRYESLKFVGEEMV